MLNDSTVRRSGGQARPGVVLALLLSLDFMNGQGLTKQVQTVLFGSSGAADYAFTLTKPDGTTEVYTFKATAAESTAALTAAAFESYVENSFLGAIYSASTSSATTTLTTRVAGQSWSLSQPSNTTVTETTAAAGASDLYVGRALINKGGGNARSIATPNVKHPRAADFTAQAGIATFSSVASGDVVELRVTFRGIPVSVKAPFNTNNNTTVSDLATAANTRFDALFGADYGLVASASTGALTVTAENAGDEFTMVAAVMGSGGGTVALTGNATPAAATSLRRSLWGVSTRDGGVRWDDTVNAEIIPAKQAGSVLTKGDVYVASTQTIAQTDEVYLGTSSTESGRFYNSAAAGRVWLPREVCAWRADDASGGSVPASGIALLNVNI